MAAAKAVASMQEQRSKFKPVRKHPGKEGSVRMCGCVDVKLEGFMVEAGGKVLLDNASVMLTAGAKFGLVGRNGIGKTSFLRALCGGDIDGVPKGLQVLHVEQEAAGEQVSALNAVLSVDEERTGKLCPQAMLGTTFPAVSY